ncbi:hypothetical protein CCACVL1_23128 [Corchorus capsularis]|uniref:Myb/SANT-like DNA-binding domain-containing protein n=1 Tax=Corchorus capsularis TaxID=210143 RepID=A0A1R3GV63_COCAP|nr:hypothetical protein CCACVL1_23128 [Corchorus capsularis]
MGNEDEKTSRPSAATRRTRSQASTQWGEQQVLILVNEIAAIEADCSNALSSFQKWKIIVQNCNALGVPHSSIQCRRKWNLLLQEYNKIKRWESQSQSQCDSYWSLGVERRNEFALPQHFDKDLFDAIRNVVELLDDKSGTDRDSDPEAQDDPIPLTHQMITHPHPGPRKQSRNLKPLRSNAEAKSSKRCGVEKAKKIHVVQVEVEQPHESRVVEKIRTSKAEEENLGKREVEMKPMFNIEEEQQIMVARLSENAEQIHAIVEEIVTDNNADQRAAGLNNIDEFRTDFIRRQGDKLITCLGDILSTLN